MIDDMGKLWELDLSSRNTLRRPPAKVKDSRNKTVRVGPRHQPDPGKFVAIAVTAQSCMNAFWVDKGIMYLETVTQNNEKVARPINLASASHDRRQST